MPSLSNLPSNKPVKGLYMGDPGAGKTGSLAGLVAAGYKLRIYDFDNLLVPLYTYAKRDAADKLSNVSYQTFTDAMQNPGVPAVMIGGRMAVQSFTRGTPTAFVNGLKQLTKWYVPATDTSPAEDLGDPGTWGRDTIVVIDTLTNLAARSISLLSSRSIPSQKNHRPITSPRSKWSCKCLRSLGSEQFNTNVLRSRTC
jgi:hypothetical protein